jgi:hypothetical protein
VVSRNEKDQPQICRFHDVRISAFNGERVDSNKKMSSIIPMRLYDFIILTFKVEVEVDIEYEVDFLSMTLYLDLQFYEQSLTANGNLFRKYYRLRCDFFDENEIWKHYVEIPGGIILLRRDCELLVTDRGS